MNRKNNLKMKQKKVNKSYRLVIILIVSVLVSVQLNYVKADNIAPNIVSEAAILVDLERGQVLYSKNTDTKLHIAVASKIMTAIIAIEKAKLDSQVIISKDTSMSEGALRNNFV